MSEFKEEKIQGEYKDVVTAIAKKLAVNKYNALNGKNVDLDSEIDENIKVVNKKIEQIYKDIKNKMPNLSLPRNLNDTIAEYLLREVENGAIEINQLDSKGSITEKIFFEQVLANKDPEIREAYMENKKTFTNFNEQQESQSIDEKIEKMTERLEREGLSGYQVIKCNPENSDYIDGVGVADYVLRTPDGREILFVTKPENEAQKIPKGELPEVELEIEAKKNEIERIFANLKLKPKEKTTSERLEDYDNLINGLGVDAAMRDVYSRLTYNGVITFIRNDDDINVFYRESLKKLLTAISPENAHQRGYEEDQYTIMNKMGIYSRIMNDPAIQGDSRYQIEIRELLKTADPELYERLEKDPLLFEKMQAISGEEDFLAAANVIMGNEILERDNVFDIIDDFIEQHKDFQLSPKQIHKYDNFEKKYLDEMNDRRRAETKARSMKLSKGVKLNNGVNLLKNQKIDRKTIGKIATTHMLKMSKIMFAKKGPGVAVASLFNKSKIEGKMSAKIIPVEKKILDFDNIDKPGNYVSQITSKDIEIMQKALEGISEYKDDEKFAIYISALEEIIEKSKENLKEWNEKTESEKIPKKPKEKVPRVKTKFKKMKSSKEDYTIPDNESVDVEVEIEMKRNIIQSMYDKAELSAPGTSLEDLESNYNKLLNGLGIDAAMRYTYDQLDANGAIQFLRTDDDVNMFYKNTLINMLDAISPKNANQRGYIEDQYTMMNKLGIYSKLMNDPLMKENGESAIEIRNAMKKADPELYAMLEKDPQLFEKIQFQAGNKDILVAAAKITEKESLSRSDVLDYLEQIRRQAKSYDIEVDDPHKYERFEENYLIELNARTISRNVGKEQSELKADSENKSKASREEQKKNIKTLIEKVGVGATVKRLFKESIIAKDKTLEIISIMGEMLDFQNEGNEDNYVDRIKSEDIDIMKTTLQDLLENQDKSKEPYIVALGEIINKSCEREKNHKKVLSMDNVDIEDVIKKVSEDGVDMFDTSDTANHKADDFSER